MRQLKISKLGQMELKKIKRKDVQEFFNDFGKTRRRVTVLDNHKFIKASFADAVLDGLIKTNPCSRIEIVSVEDNWDVMKRKEVREKKKWLELDEYKKTKLYLIGMLNCSFQQDEKAELLFKNNKNEIVSVLKPRTYVPQMALMTIYVALKTGARVSEILGLTKEDVDFDSATLNIDKTWDYKFGGGFTETKNTSSIRKIGVDKEFLRVMEIYFWWLDKHNIKTDQGAIFVKEKVKVHNSLPNSILKRIFECLEIEPISLHKLRHTHASILIAQGISLQVIAKRLGHSDTSMIQKTYGHLLESVEERENKRILEVI
jgi:integrase